MIFCFKFYILYFQFYNFYLRALRVYTFCLHNSKYLTRSSLFKLPPLKSGLKSILGILFYFLIFNRMKITSFSKTGALLFLAFLILLLVLIISNRLARYDFYRREKLQEENEKAFPNKYPN